jgi:hypothetical protein
LPENIFDYGCPDEKENNLLVHLARIDGKLDVSEQDMLQQLVKEYQVTDFEWKNKNEVDLNDYKNVPSKSEILFLALRMIRADGIIHPDEAAYCSTCD